MRTSILILGLLFGTLTACGDKSAPVDIAVDVSQIISIDPALANRFSALALSCVAREYPNKIAHTMSSDEDAKTPSQLHPTFYGCFDWHSSVHAHWLLVRLLNIGDQDASWRAQAIEKLDKSFTAGNIAIEVEYFANPNLGSYERPYGLAWLL